MTFDEIPWVIRALAKVYRQGLAPVALLEQERTQDPFRILVATILSARTRDETTIAVVRRLFSKAPDPGALARLSVKQIEKLIYPTGFYVTKARHLKALPSVLESQFGGRIPETIPDLCRLPGVGRKTANLVLTAAFDKPAICVDVHVHRICNRWGLIQTRNPLETEMTLRRELPRRYWKRWNSYLVAFGQTLCMPRQPRCATCPLATRCPRIGVNS